MSTATQAEFARLMGVNRSTVTRTWKQAGRLVMVGDLVDVEASRARILATADLARSDVAERHAAERGAVVGQGVETVSVGAGDTATATATARSEAPPPTIPAIDHIGNSYQAARAVKEKYAALSAKAEYERVIGLLLPRQDVDQALDDLVATVRSGLENLPHRAAGQLVGKDYDAIIALLKQEVVDMMSEMHKSARQQLATLTGQNVKTE
jgi:DNA-binding protein Fis